MEKICKCCHEPKPISDFGKSIATKDGLGKYCKACRKQKFHKHKSLHPHRKMSRKFGITEEDYDVLYINQDGKCSICGTHQNHLKRALAIDHDHQTLKIRGLLCGKCNQGLGYFNDNLILLEEAIKYLKRWV